MKWRVTLAEQTFVVDLPERLPRDGVFPVSVGDSCHYFRLQDDRLFLIEQHSASEQSLAVRHAKLQKRPDSPETDVSFELWNTVEGSHRISAVVERSLPGSEGRRAAAQSKGQLLRSDITGKVIEVAISIGDQVQGDSILMIVEAMKMENKIFAKTVGIIKKIHVKAGDLVKTGETLIEIGPISEASI